MRKNWSCQLSVSISVRAVVPMKMANISTSEPTIRTGREMRWPKPAFSSRNNVDGMDAAMFRSDWNSIWRGVRTDESLAVTLRNL